MRTYAYLLLVVLSVFFLTDCSSTPTWRSSVQVAGWCGDTESQLELAEAGRDTLALRQSTLDRAGLTMSAVLEKGVFIFGCHATSNDRINVGGKELYVERVPLDFYRTRGDKTPYGLVRGQVAELGTIYYIANGPDSYGRVFPVKGTCPTYYLYGYPYIPLVLIPRENEPKMAKYFQE